MYFAINGSAVFLSGLLLQVALVEYIGMSHDLSYLIQTAASVQFNFALSRKLTWRDRKVSLLPALARFNLQQFSVTSAGMIGYVGLDHLGMNYIVANLTVTVLLTPVSFASSHWWSMKGGRRRRSAHGGTFGGLRHA